MPFEPPSIRPFLAEAIPQDAPAVSGVYGITSASEWIYIGETDNIQAELLRRLRDVNTVPAGGIPAGFVFEMCDRARRTVRQDRLVQEYEPRGNRHWSQHR